MDKEADLLETLKKAQNEEDREKELLTIFSW
jgi:hypothetical protein